MLSAKKRLAATITTRTGLAKCSFEFLKLFMPYIRIINYHGVPSHYAGQFESHLQYYQSHFMPAVQADLENLLNGVTNEQAKPGLIITFDDGIRSNYLVASHLLEKYGFTGWFFVPTEFIDAPEMQQVAFATANRILFDEEYSDGRIAMSWDELRQLSTRHVIGCHTATHHRMHANTTDEQLLNEIVGAKTHLEKNLARSVDSYCWVGGEEWAYSSGAAEVIRSAGYKYAFMTNTAPVRFGSHRHQLNRTNIDASWEMDVVQFQLSGLLDLVYTPKRARVNALTAASVVKQT